MCARFEPRANGRARFGISSAAIPMPGSTTAIATMPSRSATPTRTAPPVGENFTAFATTFVSACSIRIESPMITILSGASSDSVWRPPSAASSF